MKNNQTKEQLLKNAKPILFNTEMVKAILDGRKTQTRRVIKGYQNEDNHRVVKRMIETGNIKQQYKKGDILYVGETFGTLHEYVVLNNGMPDIINLKKVHIVYRASQDSFIDSGKWKPSINMPKEYARILLKVTDARVERLHDIENNDDFEKEGYPIGYELKYALRNYSNDIHGEVDYEEDCMIEWWVNLWDTTATDGYKWEDNPYVFVYEFKRVGDE